MDPGDVDDGLPAGDAGPKEPSGLVRRGRLPVEPSVSLEKREEEIDLANGEATDPEWEPPQIRDPARRQGLGSGALRAS